MTPDGILTDDGQILGAMWILPRDGVRVLVSDTMYSGSCFSEAIGDTLRDHPDVDLHWLDGPGFLPHPLDPYPDSWYAALNRNF